MRWGESNTAWYDRVTAERMKEAVPQLWFAWRPVRLVHGGWVWREYVYWSRRPEKPWEPRGVIQYTLPERDLPWPTSPSVPAIRPERLQGGYQAPSGGPEPPVPTTGSGVKKCR